ncbi:Fe-S cluster assembly iron-binding protein IscA [Paenibacillus sp. yr247]|uniref:heme biosynthesis protein HemY n=1 Tax=Paenibacillus sp. yr247 TaxID=1761880 RepID=UPI00088BCE9D|nr:heme biosynthesis protein HemY [Paenibacillus sp. yr247]SDO81455.1 Fe-S cluster assembly iron-binding protein IscA [Paenibacillus sp. yr247]
MKCKINRNAAKVLKNMLSSEESKGKMIRVFITQNHGDHAHYDVILDTPTEHDEIVKTDKDIEILLDKREGLLDGVWIQYFHVPQDGFFITNPSTGFHDK